MGLVRVGVDRFQDVGIGLCERVTVGSSSMVFVVSFHRN